MEGFFIFDYEKIYYPFIIFSHWVHTIFWRY